MTDQRLLPFHDGAWHVPYWCYELGYVRSSQVLRLVHARADIIARAQTDGIDHVAPILLALGRNPAEARRRVGKAVWKKIHHSDLSLNVARANVLLRSRIQIKDLVEFPRGALREVLSKSRRSSDAAVTVAGLIARNRTEFREAVMLAHDTIRMGGTPNPKWSLRRLCEEHDRKAMEWAYAKSDRTPWAAPWSCEMDGFKFTLLNGDGAFSFEGITQRNCVASYADDAKRGRCMVMRIEGKERATVRFGGHPVHVQEVKARFNAPASEDCRKACAKVCAVHLTSDERARK
ncbi:PcfJ domain-containing protein [Maritimibacter sp. UBA3975]|uniref:PcfJ domain-containing protein n=1 Tax=Maritimibacter sp. UBA3975 TaxID=1946833 RepID=UPI000C0AC1A7|nr:PcfJ domain-containing protein [Maritimibacter sp. UBA3975]MAM60824.1 hypothetical protein [Maritimibacter sp.]|tara:strand:+ start:9108 stop:9977 length:870 start_codon:yes stop_codon:yes gene_type:complete